MQFLHKTQHPRTQVILMTKGSFTSETEDHYRRDYQRLLVKLRTARVEARLTQGQVAARLGRSQSFVSRSETGKRRVDVIELQAFASIYRKPLSYFFGDVVERSFPSVRSEIGPQLLVQGGEDVTCVEDS